MINLTPRLEEAVRVAARAHKNQLRKSTNIPYIIHPYSVMLLAAEITDDEDILIACLFHDILEDVPDEYSQEQMANQFGERVVQIVLGVTKNDEIASWQERADAYLEHLEKEADVASVIVSAADKAHNLMSIIKDFQVQGETLWDRFNSGKERQLWWYKSVLKVIKIRLPHNALIDRLESQVKDLEQIVA